MRNKTKLILMDLVLGNQVDYDTLWNLTSFDIQALMKGIENPPIVIMLGKILRKKTDDGETYEEYLEALEKEKNN